MSRNRSSGGHAIPHGPDFRVRGNHASSAVTGLRRLPGGRDKSQAASRDGGWRGMGFALGFDGLEFRRRNRGLRYRRRRDNDSRDNDR
jgi:hypothetical protein